jgi:DnaJ-class molecular chaperone
MTHYQTLGIQDNASPEEIKRAYRRLASQHHPDKGGDTARFQEIQTAYDVLGDEAKRQQYDLERQGGWQRFHFGGHPMDEIFRQFHFREGSDPFHHFRQPQQRRNKDLRISIPIPLVTTLEEQVKTVSVQTTNGQREIIEVRIPRGVTSETSIKYPGLGDNLFSSIPRGDLYVNIVVHSADNFLVSGIDLYTKISVNCLHAITGGSATVQGLDSKTFEIHIPAGTQANTKFRIPGQGLYRLNSDQRGDLYAETLLTVPRLDQQQIELLQTIVNPQ